MKNGEQAIACIERLEPQLVFLDIRMPVMDGLAVAKQLSVKTSPPLVVFCTAFDEYALTAFQTMAVGYLVKPVDRHALPQVLDKIRKLLPDSPLPAESDAFLVSKTINGVTRILVKDILVLKAEQKYVVAITPSGEFVLDDTLKEIEQKYPNLFLRVHRNALVNPKEIQALTKTEQGFDVIVGDRYHIAVSRRLLSDVKQLLT